MRTILKNILRSSMSLENLFSILPAGVESKNDIGLLITLFSIISWSLDEPLRRWKAIEKPFIRPRRIMTRRPPK